MAQYDSKKNKLKGDNDTLYEVVMVADQLTALAGGIGGVSTDAFGRQRVAEPFTLFDSFTRYDDNEKFWNIQTGGASGAVGSDGASIDMTVDGNGGEYYWRETKKVFAYQPGKSLQIMNTFVMNEGKSNLRQRVGYFGTDNGIFLELDGTELYIVKRAYGSDIRVAQSNWNIDKADGTGRSLFNLDITKAQIFWTDIEWLGVGSVRCGFVYNGVFVHCHTFHHANSTIEPYMATACLPIRYEIQNTGATGSSSTLKQICSTVISEGGYRLSGTTRSIGRPGNSPRDLTSANTFYPVLAIRLKDDRRDAIVIPSGLNAAPIAGNNSVVNWRVYKNATVTGGSWLSAGISSSVSYNVNPTSFTGGELLGQGYVVATNQSAGSVQLSSNDLFAYQLERNSDSSETLLIAASSTVAGDDILAAINWEEIT
jgi:hypothetical protein